MQNELNRRRTLWIVDDSPTDAERVRRLFCNDYNIEMMDDGAVALERLASSSTPDLMLLDWMMPGLSGIDVCTFVRASGNKVAQLPIILLTAQHGAEEIVQAFKCGANDYVSKPFVDEELKARVKTLIDTKTLLERAENAEADVRTLLMNAPDPIFAIDAQGNVSFANGEALAVTGKTKHSVAGMPFEKLIPDFAVRNIALGAGVSLLPLPDVSINGRVFSPSVRILPSDTAATTTVSLRDVTERRKTDARRLDFYSVIAHDLRTPITSVLMRIQLAFRGKHGILPATLTDDLQRIERSLRSQVGMVNDFLELAKLEGTGYKVDRLPIDLVTLIRTTMEDFEPLLEKQNLSWKQSFPAEPIQALGDKARISQVLANLIGNAIKFTNGPGVVTTSVTATDDAIEVSIEDTGRGIPAEDLPLLFERFTRVSESANETIGTGLGLMIVKEIIAAHGGLMGVDSKPKEGSRFWFRLPRA